MTGRHSIRWRRAPAAGGLSPIVALAPALSALALLGLACPAAAADLPLFKAPPIAQAVLAPGWTLGGYFYSGNRNIFGVDPNTSAQISQSGGVGVLQYETLNWNFAVLGQAGRSHVMYLQAFDDMYVQTAGVGLRAAAKFGPMTATIGGSFARDSFQDVQPTATNNWKGNEQEIHAIVSADWNPGGPVWFKPMVGFRHLELSQDAHFVALATSVPQDTRTSDLLFLGSRLEFVFPDQANGAWKPWIFGGYTHEFRDVPSMGPSVFLVDQIAGNQFSIFPAGTLGTPLIFPARDTTVFGVGIDIDVRKFLTVRAAYYHEFNDAYDSDSYKIGASLHW